MSIRQSINQEKGNEMFDMSNYVDVAERIRQFRAQYPTGSLQPSDPSKPFEIVTIRDGVHFVVYVAAAYRTPDDPRPGIGVAWEKFPGDSSFTRDSELMNAETSAWGRAIVAALAADTQKIATVEEIRNRQSDRHPDQKPSPVRAVEKKESITTPKPTGSISQKQIGLLMKLGRERGLDSGGILDVAKDVLGMPDLASIGDLSSRDGSAVIKHLLDGSAA
jgi:hypothetical protein